MLFRSYRTHGKHEIYAKGKSVNLESYEHSLVIDAADAARVRPKQHDVPMTAAEEDRLRRKKAWEEAAKVRQIYEELVLKKPQPAVVQIGSLAAIRETTGGNGGLASTGGDAGNGHANGNGDGAVAKTESSEVALPAGD